MPIPLDWRELDSHIEGRILFNLKDPIKSLFLSTSVSLSSVLPPSLLSVSFPVKVEMSYTHHTVGGRKGQGGQDACTYAQVITALLQKLLNIPV